MVMSWKKAAMLLILLVISAAYAVVSPPLTFTSAYDQGQGRVITDVAITPSLSLNSIYCIGDTITPVVNVQSNWHQTPYPTVYSTRLNSNVNTGNCVLGSSDSSLAPITWISSGIFGSLNAHPGDYFTDRTEFNGFVNPIGISPLTTSEGSFYLNPSNEPNTFATQGKADVALYAKGTAKITANGYNPSLEYTGASSINTFPSFQLNTLGPITFTPEIDVTGAMVSAATYHATGGVCNTIPSDSVNLYRNGGVTFNAAGTPIIITVENPFVCSIGSVPGPNPAPAHPGDTVSFSFDITNGGSKDVSINSGQITLASGSILQNLQITAPSYPITVPHGGATHITGTVLVPIGTAANTYPLNLHIIAQSTSVDCKGLTKTCDTPSLLAVNVVVTSGGSIICSQIGLSQNQFPTTGGSAQATASCTLNGVPTACPGTGWSWAHTLAPPSIASFSSPTTPTPIFTVNSGATVQSGTVTASLNGIACPAPVAINVVPGGAITCDVVSLSPNSFPPTGGDGQLSATCKQNGGSVTCPPTGWSWSHTLVPTANAIFIPSVTSPPTLTFRVLSGTNPSQSGTVTATLNGVQCATPAQVSITGGGQTCSLSISSKTPPYTFTVGELATDVVAACQNPALCPTLTWSVASTPPNFGSLRDPSTPAGNSPTNQFTPLLAGAGTINAINGALTCTVPGGITINSGGAGIQLNCEVDPVHGNVFFPPDSSDILAHCTEGGVPKACPKLDWTHNIQGDVVLNTPTAGGPTPIRNKLTINSAPQQLTGASVTVRCTNPAECAPNAQCDVATIISNTPNSMVCQLKPPRVPPIFSPGEQTDVTGDCKDNNGQTACPRLQWKLTMNPVANPPDTLLPQVTEPKVQPSSHLTFSIDPTNRNGNANAISIDPRVPSLTCQNPVLVQVGTGGVGPDYEVVNVSSSKIFPSIGETVRITVNIRNIGLVNPNRISTTRVTVNKDCVTAQEHTLQSLATGQMVGDATFICNCNSIGIHTITATADVNDEIGDTNRGNNVGVGVYFCGAASLVPTCADYV